MLLIPLKPHVLSSFYKHFTVHCSEADMTACDNSGMTPFMLALENGHKEVAKVLLENNTQCLYLGRRIIDWALEKNLTLFFQVM